MILHKPGTVVEYVLPSDREKPEEEQTVVAIRVPDEATFRKLMNLRPKGNFDAIEVARMKFGYYVAEIRNLGFADGTPVELRRDPSGAFTRECMLELQGIVPELDLLVDDCTRVTGRERKNS